MGSDSMCGDCFGQEIESHRVPNYNIYSENNGVNVQTPASSNSNSTNLNSNNSTPSNSNNTNCWPNMLSSSVNNNNNNSNNNSNNNNNNNNNSNNNNNATQNNQISTTSNNEIPSLNSLHELQETPQRNGWNFVSMASYPRSYIENHYNAVEQSNHNPGNNQIPVHHNLFPHNSNQIYKRFYYNSGKSGNSKDICGEDKHKEDGDPWNVDAPAAFLGPNLWDRTLPYDTDLKVHPYVDLDEFLSENCMPSVDGLPSSHLGHSTSLGHRSDSLGHSTGLSLSGLGQVTKRERSPSPSDCMSPDTMNPPSPADSNEELKPQPMIKKSRKQFVPDELKDDKYWARRRKNNMAAKRSRDARRMKENQIALRAGFLEKENMSLHRELEQLKQENMELRARLSKYQEV